MALAVGLGGGGARADDGVRLPLEIQAPHSLSREAARQRVQQLLDYWRERFGVQRTWSGEVAHIHGHVMGVAIDAELVISEDRVMANASDPGSLLRGAAMAYVEKKLRKYLHPSYAE